MCEVGLKGSITTHHSSLVQSLLIWGPNLRQQWEWKENRLYLPRQPKAAKVQLPKYEQAEV